jgi:hypothetical protein
VEARFFRELGKRVRGLDEWYHRDADGTPWMLVSYTFVANGGLAVGTLRLDYDGWDLRGGWSPSDLNWDDGVRAADAQVDTGPPDGLSVDCVTCEEAVEIAAEWFGRHVARDTKRTGRGRQA